MHPRERIGDIPEYGVYEAASRRRNIVRDEISRFEDLLAFGAAVSFGIGLILAVAMFLTLLGEEVFGGSYESFRSILGIGLAVASVVAFSPLATSAVRGILHVVGRVALRRAIRDAERRVRNDPDLTLDQAIWGVRSGHGALHGTAFGGAERVEMLVRVGRAITRRYGQAAQPGGILSRIETLPTPAATRFAKGWDGSADEFVARASRLDEDRREMLIHLAATVSGQSGGWANDLLATLEEEELDSFHTEAIVLLTRGWEGTAAELVKTAKRL